MTRLEKITLVILLGSVAAIGPFTTDMYLPGLPSIARDLGVSQAEVSYTLTGYFIGISIGQLFYGPLIDRYGRKRPLLIGLCIYALASTACFLVPNLYTFIAFRFLQALGASAGMVASTAIVRDQFKATEVARTLSSILLVMGVAPIIAPSLGGFLIRVFSWKAVFVFLSVLSIILVINLFFFLKETRGFHSESTLKIKSVLINYKNELKNKSFTNFSLAGSLAMAIMYAYIASISYILMTIYGVSNRVFGWLFAINAIGYVGGSQLNNYLLKKKIYINLLAIQVQYN
ncbi:multidrug effflux MFS transporter [Weeksellaceae bacterium TAE3-ERU29]|nr:multidrug effflux MFS transporter [Weeksellaceae bacterium TAE3-ERU29]